jgi:hypothetical protein
MEDDTVVVATLGKSREVFAGLGGLVGVEFDGDGALEL